MFELVVDDYAEVWVDGQAARALGQVGGSVVGGFNVPNRSWSRATSNPAGRSSSPSSA